MEPSDHVASATVEELPKWAFHEDVGARMAVASRQDCPTQLLQSLARDKAPVVRMAVAQNPRLSPSVVAELTADDIDNVAARATGNLGCPPEALAEAINRWMATGEGYPAALSAYRNPNCPTPAKKAWEEKNPPPK